VSSLTGALAVSSATGGCENFLYGFKAARRAARAADTARTPTLPLRRRQRRSAGAKGRNPRGCL